jgi:HPt (histidine-containing phosphotransfer) domain-containing protein
MSHIFDYNASLARMGDDESLLREMAALLLEDGPQRMQQALEGLHNHNANGVIHAAHTLKGLTANFGAARAVAAAARLEDLARKEKWAEMGAATDALQLALIELLQALRPLATDSLNSSSALDAG